MTNNSTENSSTSCVVLDEVEQYEQTPLAQRFPRNSTYALMVHAAQAFGEQTALSFLPSGERDEAAVSVSFAQLAERIHQTANLLHSLGIKPSDTVSVLLPSLLETHYALWGTQAAAIVNPINPFLDTEHIIEIMNKTQAKVLISLAPDANVGPSTAVIWDKVDIIAARVASLETVLLVGPSEQLPKLARADIKVINFGQAIALQPADRLLSNRVIKGDELAAYFHTGGTTASPKVAQLSHSNISFTAQLYADKISTNHGRASLCALPLFHIFGVVAAGIAFLVAGSNIVIMSPDGFRNPAVVKNWWHHISRFNVKTFSAVPTILAKLLDVPVGDSDISCLEEAGCGAAALPIKVKAAFEKNFGISVTSGYGMTESSCLIARPLPGHPFPAASVGTRLPYMQMKIAQVDGTELVEECKTGDNGAVLIKGPHVFVGYLDPKDDAKAWVDDSWFNTGDLGFIDEQGFLSLTGRAKDLIIRGGHNIDPELIEEPLGRHPAISMAVAIGQPDAYAGEIPVAYVTLKPNQSVDAAELLAHCQATISERAAVPKRIEIITEIPLTVVGKVFKPTLRNQATEFVVSKVLTPLNINAEVVARLDPQRGQVAAITLALPEQQEQALAALEDLPIIIDFI